MASSHHRHCHHPPPITAPYCHPCCCNCTPSPPPPPATDPLLQSIASHLLLRHSPPPRHQPHLHHQLDCHPPQTHKHKQHSRKHRHREYDADEEEEQSLPIVSSLLRRIAALESSLRHHSPARFSLRDAAARTIQTHFRAFLVRRSRTLRQLKDLAFIKSALNVLKSSVSDSAYFDYHVLSQETMGLLIKLDSIKGGDPMIRDEKRSINRELIRFLEFIDEVSLKRQVLYSSRVVKNVGFGKNGAKSRVSLGDDRKRTVNSGGFSGDERKALEKLRNRVQKIEKLSRDYEEGEADNIGVEDKGLSVGGDERKVLEKLRNRVQKIEELSRVYEEEEEENIQVGNKGLSTNGNRNVSQSRVRGLLKRQGQVQPEVKKSVSFVENGNVYRIIRSRNGSDLSGDSDSFDENDLFDGEKELMNNLCKEVEEIRVSPKETEDDLEEDGTEETESTETSGDEKDHQRGNAKARDEYEIRKQIDQDEDDGFAFSALLPVKMEARADLMNKKQPLRNSTSTCARA